MIRLRAYVVLLIISFFICGLEAQTNDGDRILKRGFELFITDENGNPLAANVVIGEGSVHFHTNNAGRYVFIAYPHEVVSISLHGYESVLIRAVQLAKNNTVKLVKAKLYQSENDKIHLPFTSRFKRHLTSSSSVLKSEQLDKYPTVDIRNSFAGLAPGLEVVENYGSTGIIAEEHLGNYGVLEKISMTTRNLPPIYIVDDVPVNLNELQLEAHEIGSVTILKDVVAKAMFGPQGANGVIFIKTKRGSKNERILNVNVEAGTQVVDRFPGFVTGADYVKLNNLARINSGLPALYTDEAIAQYAKNDPYNLDYPSVNWRDLTLKNSKGFRRMNVSALGGNDIVQYFTSLAYSGEGDMYKLGNLADFNRLSARSNLDINVNELVDVQFDFYGGLTLRRSPNYAYGNLLEMDNVLYDINSIAPVAFPVYANNESQLEKPWYGVSYPVFPTNPVGALTHRGHYSETGRIGNAALAFNYDIKKILPGLKSKTYIGFQALNFVRLGKEENYSAYNIAPGKTADGQDTICLSKVRDGVDASGLSELHDYFYHRFSVYQNFSFEKSIGMNKVYASLTHNIASQTIEAIREPRRFQNSVLFGSYTYNDKYSVEAVLDYSGTYSYAPKNRFKLFPSVGVSSLISEEKFLKNISWIDFLKIRAQAGLLGYDDNREPFLYNEVMSYNITGMLFGPSPSGIWFGSEQDKTGYRTMFSRTANPDLSWEVRKEFNAGFEALLLDKKLSLEVNYYHHLRNGVIAYMSNAFPFASGLSNASYYQNYNNYKYFGIETALQYSNALGSFKYSIGGNASYQNTRILKIEEPNYRFDYQSVAGSSIDYIYGYTYLGKFASDQEAKSANQIFSADLKNGDLKYEDANNDGIVDSNDRRVIGNSTPRLVYAVNINLSYKNIDFALLGTGRAFYNIFKTNSYFWGGWGDSNYSNFMKENIGGEYPRLTYQKVDNNFQLSKFWLMDGGFFKFQNVELAYNLPENLTSLLRTRSVRIYLRGANLLTLSKVKDVDPESVNSGILSYPLFKTFTAGLKFTF